MARFIPDQIPIKNSSGERKLFQKIKFEKETYDWIVFHSLDIAKHINQFEGEIDLLIIIPSFGIVGIEIKACEVKREDGKWIYSYGTSTKGPFKQISDSLYSLREWLINKNSIFYKIPFAPLVAFTEINFNEKSPEWHDWEFINYDDLRKNKISFLIKKFINETQKRIQSLRSYNFINELPDQLIDETIDLLRSNFVYEIDKYSITDHLNDLILEKTEQKLKEVEQFKINSKLLVSGPAGTGKTLLAIKAFDWAVSNKKNILFLCFNRLLAIWLNKITEEIQFKAKSENLIFYVGTIHKFLFDKFNIDYTDFNLSSNETQIENILFKIKKNRKVFYDYLIVDEAQDLIKKESLLVINENLKNGIKNGAWLFTGDFEKQAIYNLNSLNNFDFLPLNQFTKNYFKQELRVNCRNLKRISDSVCNISKLSPEYDSVYNDNLEGDVTYYYYQDEKEHIEILKKAVTNLLEKFSEDQIFLLTMLSKEKSVLSKIKKINNFELVPLDINNNLNEKIAYSTIHSVKGLENSAVVITDINDLLTDLSKSLLYIGMTRAKIDLVLIFNHKLKKTLKDIITS